MVSAGEFVRPVDEGFYRQDDFLAEPAFLQLVHTERRAAVAVLHRVPGQPVC